MLNGINLTVPAPESHKGGSIQRSNPATGEVTTLYTHCGDRPLSAPNDLVFDRQGGFMNAKQLWEARRMTNRWPKP